MSPRERILHTISLPCPPLNSIHLLIHSTSLNSTFHPLHSSQLHFTEPQSTLLHTHTPLFSNGLYSFELHSFHTTPLHTNLHTVLNFISLNSIHALFQSTPSIPLSSKHHFNFIFLFFRICWFDFVAVYLFFVVITLVMCTRTLLSAFNLLTEHLNLIFKDHVQSLNWSPDFPLYSLRIVYNEN